jgi:hypothetical protein
MAATEGSIRMKWNAQTVKVVPTTAAITISSIAPKLNCSGESSAGGLTEDIF